jgi:hypothetical protein
MDRPYRSSTQESPSHSTASAATPAAGSASNGTHAHFAGAERAWHVGWPDGQTDSGNKPVAGVGLWNALQREVAAPLLASRKCDRARNALAQRDVRALARFVGPQHRVVHAVQRRALRHGAARALQRLQTTDESCCMQGGSLDLERQG